MLHKHLWNQLEAFLLVLVTLEHNTCGDAAASGPSLGCFVSSGLGHPPRPSLWGWGDCSRRLAWEAAGVLSATGGHSGAMATIELTFPLQLIAIPQELQRVSLIGRLDVIHIDVQVIGGVQKVIRQQGALALIQGNVDLWSDQGLPLTVGSIEVQRVGRGFGETGKQK